MLRVADSFYASDLGRQRTGNEDNFFVQSPLFVVADGMGGAQAGEVASEVAVESFRPGLGDGAPEDGLTTTIQGANRKIHEMSQADAGRAGMGTTVTAAYVDVDDVVIAHVGDSRCYRLRGGELQRLTRDHSLVGELVDRGKLTEEQAEVHPQRSVITRALGPEPDVKVDTQRIAAEHDDVFLLCSDGLTTMIREPVILPILNSTSSLEEAGRKLIEAANEAGGRDNITIILFRLEEVGAEGAADQATVEASAVPGPSAPVATREAPAVEPPAQDPDAQRIAAEEEYRRSGTIAVQAIRPGMQPPAPSPGAAPTDDTVPAMQTPPMPDAPPPDPNEVDTDPTLPAPDPNATMPTGPAVADPNATMPTGEAVPAPESQRATVPTEAVPPPPDELGSAPPPRRTAPLPDTAAPRRDRAPKPKRKVPTGLIIGLLIAFLIIAGAWIASRAVFFIGTDTADNRTIAIFRGLPYELPLGVELYENQYRSGTTIDRLPARRHYLVKDHKLRSLDDAEDLVRQMEQGRIE